MDYLSTYHKTKHLLSHGPGKHSGQTNNGIVLSPNRHASHDRINTLNWRSRDNLPHLCTFLDDIVKVRHVQHTQPSMHMGSCRIVGPWGHYTRRTYTGLLQLKSCISLLRSQSIICTVCDGIRILRAETASVTDTGLSDWVLNSKSVAIPLTVRVPASQDTSKLCSQEIYSEKHFILQGVYIDCVYKTISPNSNVKIV